MTGASSGIGEATALLLAGRGAKLVLGARRSDRLKALVDRITAAGGEATYLTIDVKRRDDLAALATQACERYRGTASGSGRQAACDRHFARLRPDGVCRVHDEPRGQGANPGREQDRHPAERDRARHRVCNRTAGRRRCGRYRCPADSTGMTPCAIPISCREPGNFPLYQSQESGVACPRNYSIARCATPACHHVY
jgi:hypothetical protein